MTYANMRQATIIYYIILKAYCYDVSLTRNAMKYCKIYLFV